MENYRVAFPTALRGSGAQSANYTYTHTHTISNDKAATCKFKTTELFATKTLKAKTLNKKTVTNSNKMLDVCLLLSEESLHLSSNMEHNRCTVQPLWQS